MVENILMLSPRLQRWLKGLHVEVIANRKSNFAHFAEGVIPRVIKAQKANVDTITGAPTTSKCLLKAVESALLRPTRIK